MLNLKYFLIFGVFFSIYADRTNVKDRISHPHYFIGLAESMFATEASSSQGGPSYTLYVYIYVHLKSLTLQGNVNSPLARVPRLLLWGGRCLLWSLVSCSKGAQEKKEVFVILRGRRRLRAIFIN